jgi:hypothetical protein
MQVILPGAFLHLRIVPGNSFSHPYGGEYQESLTGGMGCHVFVGQGTPVTNLILKLKKLSSKIIKAVSGSILLAMKNAVEGYRKTNQGITDCVSGTSVLPINEFPCRLLEYYIHLYPVLMC